MNNLVMYCQCYGHSRPLHSQFQQKPLLCGALGISDLERTRLRAHGFLFDDEGENISALNYTFGDLTGTYHIWKNSDDEFLGHNQYRRFWDENTVTHLEENTLYYTAPWVCDYNDSCAQQYIRHHGQYGMDVLRTVAKNNFKQEHVDSMYQFKYLIANNMFFGHNPTYNKFCEVLFEIMFDVFNEAEPQIKTMDNYQRRMVAFLSERVMSCLIEHSNYFFGNMKMIPVVVYKR